MQPYHLRRKDKALEDSNAMDSILRDARYVALAMCDGAEPYLVMLNHGYDAASRCLYFHCAPSGRKVDVLRANPRVWGMAVEDLGYQDGACDHAYRSVMFGGRVEFLESEEHKRTALELMIHQQESDPATVISEQLTPARIAAVTIGKVAVDQLSGKEALPEAKQ